MYQEENAWGWCTGTTQRDGMGREEGGGFRMGNTCFKIIKLKIKKKKCYQDYGETVTLNILLIIL